MFIERPLQQSEPMPQNRPVEPLGAGANDWDRGLFAAGIERLLG
jgi:hypothetical protein